MNTVKTANTASTMISKNKVEIVDLLEKKLAFFDQYEKITDEMLECPIDNMLDCVGKRQDLAHQIDELDVQLAVFYEGEFGKLLRTTISNQVEWGTCSPEMQDFFMLGQKLSSYFTRISEKDKRALNYAEEKKEELLNLIKKENTGINAKASKYYGTVKQTEENYTLFDNKY